MKQLPNIWFAKIPTFNDALDQVELCIEILKENADSADFSNTDIQKEYANSVIYMKQLFERAETLARGGDVNSL